MKKILLLTTALFSISVLHATHQRSAEITYQHLEGFTYRFTLITYTNIQSLADRPILEIDWGYENQKTQVQRTSIIDHFAQLTRENHYVIEHTFPGPGTYYISMEDPNRTGGIVNMPNSINMPMYVESKLVISPFITPANSSPVFLNKPFGRGCLGMSFMYNSEAFDSDGDSLSFRLVTPRGYQGLDIPGYHLPNSSILINLNPVTGDLVWYLPTHVGEFNVAILTEEYRMGVLIGSVLRDMQITIEICEERPEEEWKIMEIVINLLHDSVINSQNEITDLKADTLRLYNQLLDCQNSQTNNAQIIPQEQIQVFPNPVNYELRIANPEWEQGEIVELFDINGRRIYSAPANNNEIKIDMSNFQSGNYILRIGNRVARIVKQ